MEEPLSEAKSPAALSTVPAQSVVTLPDTGVTLK